MGQAPRPEGLPEKKAAPPCAGLHRPVKESVATLAAAANLPGNRPQMIEHLAIVASCHHRASREGEHGGLPPDVAKTKDRGLTSRQGIAYTNDNTMPRLHSETTSTLASTARVVDGFVPEQSDHRGSTLVVARSYSEDKAPCGRKRGIGSILSICPKGRAADGAAASQPIRWSRESNDSELGLVCYNDRHDNPTDGRWMGRDPLAEIRQSEKGHRCLYGHHVCTTMP